jgi:glycosyltransferase involved in cell wall biosynthesis
MRLLLISNFFPPAHTAGTEKRTFGYASRLLSRRHNVQVICAGEWNKGRAYLNGFGDDRHQQIPVHRIHMNWMQAPDPNRYLYRNPILQDHVRQFLAQWAPDIVHITSCLTMSASMIQAAKSLRLPVLLTLTDFWFICPGVTLLRGDGSLCDGRTTNWDCLKCMLWHTKIYCGLSRIAPERLTAKMLTGASKQSFLSRRRGLRGMALDMEDRRSYLHEMLEAADIVTAPSAYLAKTVKKSGVTKPIKVIRSGHDLNWLKSLPSKKPCGRIRIGYVGQIVEIKGVDVLLSAFLSGSLTESARLTLYGDPSTDPHYMKRLNAMAAGNDAGIRFHGPFAHDSLGEVLSEIDVLVVPSRWHENNPRVIQEAFAGGTPVVASNVGGISEFVQHEKNGLLFERENAQDLGRQLKRIVDEPQLLKQLRNGIGSVKTIEEEVDELEAIYRDLISKKQKIPQRDPNTGI